MQLFIKEIIPAAAIKFGKYVTSLTHGVLPARTAAITLAFAYLATLVRIYSHRASRVLRLRAQRTSDQDVDELQ